MNLKTRLYTLLLIISSLLLFACGGGSDGTSTNQTEQQGQFVDSLVSGLRYETPTTSGVTNIQGQFNYRSGETIRFFVGDVLIGEALGQAIITPVELVDGAVDESNVQVQNIAMFLQSIDDDGNDINGINITSAANTEATGKSVDFSLAEGVFESDSNIQTVINEIMITNTGLARPMVSRAQAITAFRNNLFGLYTGTYEGTFSGDDTGSWRVTVDINGNISGTSISSTYGSDTISGNISSSGKSSMNGEVGSAIFSGDFSRSGNANGNWIDDNGASGAFTGTRTSIYLMLPVENVNTFPTWGTSSGGGLSYGSFVSDYLAISGDDVNVAGISFTLDFSPVVIDSISTLTITHKNNTLLDDYDYPEYTVNVINISINKNTGSVDSIHYIHSIILAPASEPTSMYRYTVNCEDTPQVCSAVEVDMLLQQVSIINLSLEPDTTASDAIDTIILNGALSW